MYHVLRALTLLALLPPQNAAAAGPPAREALALQAAVEQAVARAEPAVACVAVSRSTAREVDLSQPETVPDSYGSGLVIDRSGLVLTCAHVINNAQQIYVRLPGGHGSLADVHAKDPRSDLAVLRLQEAPGDLKAVTLGDGGKLRKGQFVIGLSNPYLAGYRDGSPSASWGIVSNLRRRAPGKLATSESDRALQSFHRFGTLIQTDVRLSLGCSGGALVNLDGEVVGITTALAALTGVEAPGGFAVPVDGRMRQVINALARGEEVEYGFLGVQLTRNGVGRNGVRVSGAVANSPAERAGLEDGDEIVEINGVAVRDNDELFLQISTLLTGSEVRLKALKRGRSAAVALPPVRVAKLYVPGTPVASRRPEPRAGLRVDYGSVLTGRSVSPQVFDAVAIREVVPGSPAAANDKLQPERLITRVNGRPVTTPAEFYEAMDQAGGRAALTLISPEGREEVVTLTTR